MSECCEDKEQGCECQMLKTIHYLIRKNKELEAELDSLKQFIFEQGCGSGDY